MERAQPNRMQRNYEAQQHSQLALQQIVITFLASASSFALAFLPLPLSPAAAFCLAATALAAALAFFASFSASLAAWLRTLDQV